jgi:hypothetical protein
MSLTNRLDFDTKEENIKEENIRLKVKKSSCALKIWSSVVEGEVKTIVSDKWKPGRRNPGPRLHSSIV